MGFESGIYKARRLPGLDTKKIIKIDNMLGYLNNSWAKEHYVTYEDYEAGMGYDKIDYQPDKIILDVYQNDYKEYDGIYTVIESWCTNGSFFHKDIMRIVGDTGEITKDNLIKIIKMTSDYLDDNDFIPVVVSRAYRYNEITDTYTAYPCDGIEVDDGESFRRIYSDSESPIYIPSNPYADADKIRAMKRLFKACVDILITVDFDKEIVMYQGGW